MIYAAVAMLVLLLISVHRINFLDGGEDYGSNIGWYWPWTPIVQVCFFGIIFCVLGA
jgi:hypothetical protein